ncbi:hypothetical protein ACWDYJ_31880 [Streptomyces sp. NPDC003042]
MASRHRFHLDQNGHSISVLYGRPGQSVEVLVDGKAVAVGKAAAAGLTVMKAELPGDPPQPFTVHLGSPDDPGEAPLCTLVIDGARYLMPDIPFGPSPAALAGPSRRGASAVSPAASARRFFRRLLRRRR